MCISFGCAVWLPLILFMVTLMGYVMKKLLLSLLVGACACISFAREVALSEIRQVAERWMVRSPGFESYEIGSIEAHAFKDVVQPIYVVSLKPQGYMVMGSDTCMDAVLEFSQRSSYADSCVNESQVAMRELMVQEQVRAIAKGREFPVWTALQMPRAGLMGMMSRTADFKQVGPLTRHAWQQNYPYNMFVPQGMPVGCVATAVSIMTAYYRWPVSGNKVFYHGDFQPDLSVRYDWDAMERVVPNRTDRESTAVGRFLMDAAILSKMTFMSGGSAAQLGVALGRCKEGWFYSDSWLMTTLATDRNKWTGELKGELDNGRVIPSTVPGHAVVIDGYREQNGELFINENYGWGYVESWSKPVSHLEQYRGFHPVPAAIMSPCSSISAQDDEIHWEIADYVEKAYPGYAQRLEIRTPGKGEAPAYENPLTSMDEVEANGDVYISTNQIYDSGARQTGALLRGGDPNAFTIKPIFNFNEGAKLTFNYASYSHGYRVKILYSEDRAAWSEIWKSERMSFRVEGGVTAGSCLSLLRLT